MLILKPTYQELESQLAELKRVQFDAASTKSTQYQTLFDSMTEMVNIIELIYDEHGQAIDFYIRDINLSSAKHLGKAKEQLIDKKASSVIKTIEDYWLNTFARVDKTGTQTSFENYGAEFDKYYYVTVWKVSNDRLGVSFTDTTDHKRRKKEKVATKSVIERISDELLEAQKVAQIGSWLLDNKTQKAEWSEEMYHIWGFDPDLGTPRYDSIVERIHPDDLDSYNNSITKAANQGVPYDIEFRIRQASGELKTIRAICHPEPGEPFEVTNFKGTNQDITAQKQFEDDLVKHQRLKAIGEMSSSIAHDFNNSLQRMMGDLEIIRSQNNCSNGTLERLDSIAAIIIDTASRVNGLQRFADTESQDNNAEFINMNSMILESVDEARPLWKDHVEKKGLTISIETDFADIPEIKGNKGELKSAFYNLIRNSVEAMPQGGDITIETGVKAEGLVISFTDSGGGMDEKTKSRVFQPFYSTKGLVLGRGLGMSGVYSIVKKHRGDIVVKFSELGKGTIIEMVLPIGQQNEMVLPIGQQNDVKNINKDQGKNQGPLAILWVDDDIGIRTNASELLELMGHKCGTADSGKNALHYLSNNSCDIVFTDIGMPDMNGWGLANAIRHKFGNKIRIVVSSGWDVDEKTKDQYEVNSILRKPFDMQQLKEVLMGED